MKLKLKRDIVIKAGTIMDSEYVPTSTKRDPSAFVMHTIALGNNASADLFVGHEVGDAQFDKWFVLVK